MIKKENVKIECGIKLIIKVSQCIVYVSLSVSLYIWSRSIKDVH